MTGERSRWWAAAAVSLLVSRWLVPAESAAQGGTLLIATVSILAAVLYLYQTWRTRRTLRWDFGDLAVLAIVATHVLSGLVTAVSPANARAAINLTIEWGAIGSTLFLLRQTMTGDDRNWFLRLLVALMTALAVFGLWQNRVWYPSIAAEFQEFERLADDRDAGRLQDPRRLAELERSLGPDAAGADAATRAALRQRVVFSTEPIGFFALANTFATGLMVAFVLLAAAAWSDRRVVTVLLLALIGTTLLLTKSRTAFVGTFVGLTAWFVLHRRSRPTVGRRTVLGGAAALVAVVAAVVLAGGGLDLEVLTEAPKSLRYRLEYWVATGQLIGDSPWTGVGLGQFRSVYLHYKLPGASEAVADPHNWLLDAWSGAGLLGFVAAIAGVLILLVRSATAPIASGEQPTATSTPSVVVTFAAAFGLAVLSSADGVTAAVVLLIAGGAFWCLRRVTIPFSAVAAAGLAVAVHLLGAGGWSMPVVVLTWLSLLGLGQPPSRDWTPGPLVPVAGALMLIGALLFGLRPHYSRLAAEASLSRTLSLGRPPEEALQRVIDADRFDPDPPLMAATAPILDLPTRIDAAKTSIRRDPSRFKAYQTLAELLAEAARPDEAVDAAREAVARYPNSAATWATLSDVADGSEQSDAAARALLLDDAMQDAGHLDKVLADSQRRALESRRASGGNE